MQGIAQIGGFAVIRSIELGNDGQFVLISGNQVVGGSEVGFVFSPDNGKLYPVPNLFFREPVSKIFIIIEGPRGQLCGLTYFLMFQLAKIHSVFIYVVPAPKSYKITKNLNYRGKDENKFPINED